MKIEAFILCYNEEKLIRYTLAHYLNFCSKVTIIDNYSTDNTISIIKNEFSERVKIVQYDSNNQLNDSAYTYIKNNCWKQSKADWVIVCDMDELLHYNYSGFGIIDFLITLGSSCPIIMPYGYNMFSETFPDKYIANLTTLITKGVRAPNFDKSILFQPKMLEEINYGPGAHYCNPVIKEQYKRNLSYRSEHLKLLHYKYIGIDYLIQKHEHYANRLSSYNKVNQFGAEYIKGKQHVVDCFNEIKNSNKLIDVI